MYKKNNDKNLNWENCEILHEVALIELSINFY